MYQANDTRALRLVNFSLRILYETVTFRVARPLESAILRGSGWAGGNRPLFDNRRAPMITYPIVICDRRTRVPLRVTLNN